MSYIGEWKKQEKKRFSGWNFSYFKNKMIEEKLPWNYNTMAKKLVRKSNSVLDMGTGGGELFSTFGPFPTHTVATEGYKPNIILAKKRLETLGVKVIDFSNSTARKMPFSDGEFDLVLNRHDAFDSREVFRILSGGGVFLTQQVGRDNLKDLAKKFDKTSKYRNATFSLVKKGLEKAGFTVKDARDWKGEVEFKDVETIIYFLKAIPWIIPDFSIDRNLRHLEKLQNTLDSGKSLVFTHHRYLIFAQRKR
ncbi:MAG: methyltransferase domain-containing protein [Candidatus Aenigmatarchaeota archaeon]